MRVAHMLTGNMIDYIEFDYDFSIARTHGPQMNWDESAARTQLIVSGPTHQVERFRSLQ